MKNEIFMHLFHIKKTQNSTNEKREQLNRGPLKHKYETCEISDIWKWLTHILTNQIIFPQLKLKSTPPGHKLKKILENNFWTVFAFIRLSLHYNYDVCTFYNYNPMLVQCWPTVCDAVLTLNQPDQHLMFTAIMRVGDDLLRCESMDSLVGIQNFIFWHIFPMETTNLTYFIIIYMFKWKR